MADAPRIKGRRPSPRGPWGPPDFKQPGRRPPPKPPRRKRRGLITTKQQREGNWSA